MAEGDTVCQAASSPLGFAIAVLALGGSSLGRRRASAQALPLPACATCPQTTPLLQTTLQRSPQPLAVYPVPNSKVPQPDSATSSALTLSQPTCTLAPGRACLSTHTLPHRPAKRPPQHPPLPTEGFPVLRSLQEPIPGPRVQLGQKMQKKTGGENSAGALRFLLLNFSTVPGTLPFSNRCTGKPASVCCPSLLMITLLSILSIPDPWQGPSQPLGTMSHSLGFRPGSAQ